MFVCVRVCVFVCLCGCECVCPRLYEFLCICTWTAAAVTESHAISIRTIKEPHVNLLANKRSRRSSRNSNDSVEEKKWNLTTTADAARPAPGNQANPTHPTSENQTKLETVDDDPDDVTSQNSESPSGRENRDSRYHAGTGERNKNGSRRRDEPGSQINSGWNFVTAGNNDSKSSLGSAEINGARPSLGKDGSENARSSTFRAVSQNSGSMLTRERTQNFRSLLLSGRSQNSRSSLAKKGSGGSGPHPVGAGSRNQISSPRQDSAANHSSRSSLGQVQGRNLPNPAHNQNPPSILRGRGHREGNSRTSNKGSPTIGGRLLGRADPNATRLRPGPKGFIMATTARSESAPSGPTKEILIAIILSVFGAVILVGLALFGLIFFNHRKE